MPAYVPNWKEARQGFLPVACAALLSSAHFKNDKKKLGFTWTMARNHG